MKKLLTQTLITGIAMAIVTGTFAQSPTNATRQRRTAANTSPETSEVKPVVDTMAAPTKSDNNTSGKSVDKQANKPAPEITADGQTNRADQSSEEAAIVPYYNNFFTTYRLGPEDVVSVTVFGQERYSKQGIVIPPSGRISLPLIPDGIFVNGKTVDQVADLIKQRYDEYIIDPQVSVSLERAASYRYSILGDVAQPGVKLMTHRMTVTEAIAEAGGVLGTGNKSKVVVLRRQANGNLAPIPVKMAAIDKNRARDNTYLVPGDQIVVPGNKLRTFQKIM